MSFAADYPDMYANMGRSERDARAVISSDQCIIDETWYFLRGCLEIPIVGSGEVFLWGLWASIKQAASEEIAASWEEAGREQHHGPFKGRLANSLSAHYTDCLSARLRVVIQPVGTRPLFVLEEPEHALALAQGSGISKGAALELVGTLMHNQR